MLGKLFHVFTTRSLKNLLRTMAEHHSLYSLNLCPLVLIVKLTSLSFRLLSFYFSQTNHLVLAIEITTVLRNM